MKKSDELKSFHKLTKKKQNAVKMLFEGNLKIEEIAKNLHIGNTTFYKWRNDPNFKKALNEYSIYQFDSALPLAVKATVDIIKHGKSEKVKLEAAQTIFKRAGLFSDNGTPELDKARVRKLTADARLAETRANMAERLSSEENEQLDEILDKLVGEANNESKKSANK